MDVRKMSKDDLETLSFEDIAYLIIKADKETKTTVELFKEICSLLELSDSEYEAKIADFFTTLTVDKRFILLNSKWDLKENHSIKTVVDESEDDLDDIEDELEDIEEIEEAEDFDDDDDSLDDIDDDDDDLDDMSDLDELEIIDDNDELEE